MTQALINRPPDGGRLEQTLPLSCGRFTNGLHHPKESLALQVASAVFPLIAHLVPRVREVASLLSGGYSGITQMRDAYAKGDIGWRGALLVGTTVLSALGKRIAHSAVSVVIAPGIEWRAPLDLKPSPVAQAAFVSLAALDMLDLAKEIKDDFGKRNWTGVMEHILRLAVAGLHLTNVMGIEPSKRSRKVELLIARMCCETIVSLLQAKRELQNDNILAAFVTGIIAYLKIATIDRTLDLRRQVIRYEEKVAIQQQLSEVLAARAEIRACKYLYHVPPEQEIPPSPDAAPSEDSGSSADSTTSSEIHRAILMKKMPPEENAPQLRFTQGTTHSHADGDRKTLSHMVDRDSFSDLQRLMSDWSELAKNRISVEVDRPKIQQRLKNFLTGAARIESACEYGGHGPYSRVEVIALTTADEEQRLIGIMAVQIQTAGEIVIQGVVTHPDNIWNTSAKGVGTALLNRAILEAHQEHVHRVVIYPYGKKQKEKLLSLLKNWGFEFNPAKWGYGLFKRIGEPDFPEEPGHYIRKAGENNWEKVVQKEGRWVAESDGRDMEWPVDKASLP